MEEIKRPDNVIVPRSVRLRIDARRALAEGTADDMRAVLRTYGAKAPNGASKADLERALTELTRDGRVQGTTAPAATATTTATPATTTKKGGD